MPLWSDIYTLSRLQRRKFRDIVDIYIPPSSAPAVPGGRGRPRSYDMTTPTYAGVPCAYVPTKDFQVVGIGGQSTENNLLTQDTILIHIDQPCPADAKVILRTVRPNGKNHPLKTHVWEVQGEGLPVASVGRLSIDTTQIYFKQGPGTG